MKGEIIKLEEQKVGIVILCRMQSKRLPGKTMIKIRDITVLERVVNRCKKINNIPVVVATSDEQEDNIIAEYCFRNNLKIFRGSEANVARRFLDCCKYFNFKNAARVNCDRVLLDINLLKETFQKHFETKSDLTSNFRSINLLKGQGCEVIRTSILENFIHEFDTYDAEHVTRWFYKNPERIKLFDYKMKTYNIQINMALDTREDLKRISKWIKLLNDEIPDSSIDEIIKLESNLLERKKIFID